MTHLYMHKKSTQETKEQYLYCVVRKFKRSIWHTDILRVAFLNLSLNSAKMYVFVFINTRDPPLGNTTYQWNSWERNKKKKQFTNIYVRVYKTQLIIRNTSNVLKKGFRYHCLRQMIYHIPPFRFKRQLNVKKPF